MTPLKVLVHLFSIWVRAICFGIFFSTPTPALCQDARGVSDSMVDMSPGVNKVPRAP